MPNPIRALRSQQRLLALAAVCQAAQLVHLLATQGEARVQQHYADALQASLQLGLSRDWAQGSTGSGGLAGLDLPPDQLLPWRLGLQTLERLLMPPSVPPGRFPQATQREVQGHVQRLLRQSRRLRPGRSRAAADRIAALLKQQQVLEQRVAFFAGDLNHPAVLAGLAGLYLSATQHQKPRILIRGQAMHMSQPIQADRLRACLWSGLVAAAAWRQAGGSWLQLLLQRRALLDQLRQLALKHFYTDSLLR